MIPEYLAIGLTLALMTYTFHSLLEIYFMFREYKEAKQPGQPGGLYQWHIFWLIRNGNRCKQYLTRWNQGNLLIFYQEIWINLDTGRIKNDAMQGRYDKRFSQDEDDDLLLSLWKRKPFCLPWMWKGCDRACQGSATLKEWNNENPFVRPAGLKCAPIRGPILL